ncbi:MAG: trypsin-like peptidase domain-containing protein [Caldilineaceae bacterium]|nr:trypsin-like peptidase domain-containing protein [Caldilineaceae bacterium]
MRQLRIALLCLGLFLLGSLGILLLRDQPLQAIPTQERILVPTATPASRVEGTPLFTTGTSNTTSASADFSLSLNSLETTLVQIYQSASNAVVNVTSQGYTASFSPQLTPEEGTGTGFFYDQTGHLVTNYHVVENAQSIVVTLADGRIFPAALVGADASTDLAVLRVQGDNLPQPLALGNVDELQVGQFALAIGNPFGLNGTLTVGVISSLGRVIESPDGRFIGAAIQTDAAINPGNSGGPLLDLQGRVIGVNSQIISTSGTAAGIGFAVPATTIQRVVPALITQGYYAHPWLGIQTLDLNTSRAQRFQEAGMNLPVESGLLLTGVVPGSPAAAAGLQGGTQLVQWGNTQVALGGDIITAINNVAVANLQELTVYLEEETQIGEAVTLTIVRAGQLQTLNVILGERPAS